MVSASINVQSKIPGEKIESIIIFNQYREKIFFYKNIIEKINVQDKLEDLYIVEGRTNQGAYGLKLVIGK